MKITDKENKLEFEILKLVFFIVTYLLITDGFSLADFSNHAKGINLSSFYNTLFIFSASTWIDYLSSLSFQKTKRFYDGSSNNAAYVSLIGSVVGIFTVPISMYCVCKKGDDFLDLAITIYYASMIFLFLKSFVITNLILKKLNLKP